MLWQHICGVNEIFIGHSPVSRNKNRPGPNGNRALVREFYPKQHERQIALLVKYDTKPIWYEIEQTFGVDQTGAAIVVAAFEAFATENAVSYSRNRSFYGPHRHQLLKYVAVLRAVDHLAAAGWITHYKQAAGHRGWQSAFEANVALIEAVHTILADKPRLRLARLPRTSILRNEYGKPIDYRRTQSLDRQDRRTEAFNEGITASNIDYLNQSNVVHLSGLACPMARIYNKTFDRGGRFYPMGTSWQNIKSEARRTLKINGEMVVELDFDGMHIAMLYVEANQPPPKDCHEIPGWPRKLVKVATFTLINATNEKSARMSIAHNDRMADLAEPGSQEAIRKARDLIEAIKRRHAPIAKKLHSDAGARLMRKDSDIAEAVMAELILRKGIIALPVHDSFLVPASKHADLEEAMMAAAYKFTGAYLSVSEAGAK